MKNTYIARQAILNKKLETIGYELLFRDSPENKFPDIDLDVASSKLIIQNHIYGDIQTISMGKLAFINFTEFALIQKYPLMFENNLIVIELMGHSKPSHKLLSIVKYYHEKGYQFALTEYDLAAHWDEFFPFIDIIKINMDEINSKRIRSVMPRIKSHNIKLAAERIETKYQQQSLAEVGFNYFQGFFYHEPEVVTEVKLTSLKTQMLMLLTETYKKPIDYNHIANIISHDVNLTVGLLKMVNNVSTGTKVEVTSLKQAAIYLGDNKLCQFIAILAVSNLTSDTADELCNQALIVGKMMDELSDKAPLKHLKEYAFITGLLSTVDIVLSMPIEKIMEIMPLAKPIEKALIERKGELGNLLQLTTAFILGEEEVIPELIATQDLSQDINKDALQQSFLEASKWCAELDIF